ncbi:hypothetical protein CEXT_318771 [Caerostris extrusa]|uniref:Uncharacterized protein n=1 Tax=Caerostris extrusa TaxID=172846 RepID=A0AAV4MFJ5_CAEEX|nr:hypothetical protein CEXT_318771 [Caerostris extrusa]
MAELFLSSLRSLSSPSSSTVSTRIPPFLVWNTLLIPILTLVMSRCCNLGLGFCLVSGVGLALATAAKVGLMAAFAGWVDTRNGALTLTDAAFQVQKFCPQVGPFSSFDW